MPRPFVACGTFLRPSSFCKAVEKRELSETCAEGGGTCAGRKGGGVCGGLEEGECRRANSPFPLPIEAHHQSPCPFWGVTDSDEGAPCPFWLMRGEGRTTVVTPPPPLRHYHILTLHRHHHHTTPVCSRRCLPHLPLRAHVKWVRAEVRVSRRRTMTSMLNSRRKTRSIRNELSFCCSELGKGTIMGRASSSLRFPV